MLTLLLFVIALALLPAAIVVAGYILIGLAELLAATWWLWALVLVWIVWAVMF